MRKITIILLFSLVAWSEVSVAQGRLPAQPLKEGEVRELFQLDPEPFDPASEPNSDMFISHYSASDMKMTAGCLKEWQIVYPLPGDDPVYPGEKGHYSTSLTALNYAVLEPGLKTDRERLSGIQKILYVAFGNGEIVNGSQRELIEQDAMVLVPENANYTIENTGNRELVMYVMVEPVPDGFKPRADVLVRHFTEGSFGSGGGHWTHGTRGGTFRAEDGLATLTGMTPVWYLPMTMGQPHAHNPGIEEIWFTVEGDFHLLLGKQFYNLPPGTAYKVPPTGSLSHSNMNLGTKPLRTFWLMYNRPTLKGQFKYGTLHPNPPGPDEANPDMYVSSFKEHYFHTVHSFVERPMLLPIHKKGARPVERGNVLNYVDRYSHAYMMAHQRTGSITLENTQEIYYILSGTATITGGGKTYNLYPGACALVPAGLEFVIDNDTEEIMEMYVVSEKVTRGFTPNKDIIVRDEKTVSVRHQSHWTYESHVLFTRDDGLSQLQNVAMVEIPPNSFAQPHAHGPEVEEVWSTIDSELEFMLGKHVRRIDSGYCYMVPPDGKAFHANYNTTGKTVRTFYFGMYDGKN
ncbi:cupin domain-containing protein [Candidatus Latescibacterota bacterium]